MVNANETVHANVKFKDRLFRIVFGAEENKKHLISLYNALNGTNFGESEAVIAAQEWPCIGPYLFKNRNKVRDVLLTEFDAELHDKTNFEAGRVEGETIGEIKSLARLVVDGLIPLHVAVSRLNMSEEDFIQQAMMLNISIKR